jgi:LuxR family maltose regulon positive regulatory protein
LAARASQPIPLLKTKLFVPQVQQSLVVRPHLLQRLDAGLHRKLTLISAPAGFGKTTLLSAWTRSGERPVAWLSLDDGDSDPNRFLAYLVAALQTIAPDIGRAVLAVLQSSQPPPIEATLTALLNDIVTIPDDFILVLDDYHVVDARAVDDALTFLLEHLPPQMHLVITTREDPRLALARLRARAQLTELRASDLRFSPAEAAEFLNQVMGLNLSQDDVATLEERTEGWVAGLQLAALSLQGHQDAPGFIRAFAGDHRYVVEYLVEEVLQRQPTPVRTFLLQTAILDHLHGPLCDAVTGQEDGIARLDSLARGNFFVVPLDDQRQWYRYHHLFADVLRAHLQAEQPEQVATLHQRASAWHERHGSVADAIRHALAAEDFARAADLVERALPAMRRSRLAVTLLGWLKALPDELVRHRPVLSVAYATALLSAGELNDVEARLQDAERWLDLTADVRGQPDALSTDMVVVDDEEFRLLPGLIAVYRAGHAHLLGNVSATMTHAQRVLDLVPEDEHLARGGAAALLGLACWTSGDLEAAHRHYSAGMASLQRAGFLSDVVNGATVQAAIRMAQGRLRDAERTLEQAVQRATELGEPSLHGTADFHVGLSEIQRERNDLHAATRHLLRSQELAMGLAVSYDRSRWYVAMARVKEAQGDLSGALDLLDEAERLYVSAFNPDVRPVAAIRARVWLKQGRPARALDWARERGLSADDDLSYLHEFEHITLARVLLAGQTSNLARRSMHEAIVLLERLLHAAEDGGRTGSVIEILVLQALAHQTRGDGPATLVPLERALTLAEPERYVRSFIDEGQPMAALLEAGAKRGIATGYARQLLIAFGTTEGSTTANRGLIEPLSERELDVLRLLGTDLDGPDIARELNVSLNTMRTHTKNIYGKLAVSNRRAAIRRAEELELLSRARQSS